MLAAEEAAVAADADTYCMASPMTVLKNFSPAKAINRSLQPQTSAFKLLLGLLAGAAALLLLHCLDNSPGGKAGCPANLTHC